MELFRRIRGDEKQCDEKEERNTLIPLPEPLTLNVWRNRNG
jgi:hypothetical protein